MTTSAAEEPWAAGPLVVWSVPGVGLISSTLPAGGTLPVSWKESYLILYLRDRGMKCPRKATLWSPEKRSLPGLQGGARPPEKGMTPPAVSPRVPCR